MTMVVPSWLRLCQQTHDLEAVLRIGLPVGSSARISFGPKTTARAIATQLLLTSGELMWEMVGAMRDIHTRHHLLHFLLAFSLRDTEISKRQGNVLFHVEPHQ